MPYDQYPASYNQFLSLQNNTSDKNSQDKLQIFILRAKIRNRQIISDMFRYNTSKLPSDLSSNQIHQMANSSSIWSQR